MGRSLLATAPDQTTAAVLRAATSDLHQSLHEHPLIVELLTRPSHDGYRAMLEGFYSFYVAVEPMIVECTRKFGIAEQYPQASRIQWLLADLQSLSGQRRPRNWLRGAHSIAKPRCVADLVGSIYVIKGSALGGQAILRKVSASLSIEGYCRFLSGEGVNPRPAWSAFQQFCDRACRSAQAQDKAIIAARQTFLCMEACLTSSYRSAWR